jgi:hypothetical protein
MKKSKKKIIRFICRVLFILFIPLSISLFVTLFVNIDIIPLHARLILNALLVVGGFVTVAIGFNPRDGI